MSDWEATAAVRPRVAAAPGASPVLLEEIVGELLAQRAPATVAIAGEHGSGKTTALKYLTARFAGVSRLIVCDESDLPPWDADGVVVIAGQPGSKPKARIWHLVPWTDDDCLEYLLARHRTRCASVLARCGALATNVGGHPALCSAILDLLAEHDDVEDADEAFAITLRAALDGSERATAQRLAFQLVRQQRKHARSLRLDEIGGSLVGSEFVRRFLAAEYTLLLLEQGHGTHEFDDGLPAQLIRASAILLEPAPELLARLTAKRPTVRRETARRARLGAECGPATVPPGPATRAATATCSTPRNRSQPPQPQTGRSDGR